MQNRTAGANTAKLFINLPESVFRQLEKFFNMVVTSALVVGGVFTFLRYFGFFVEIMAGCLPVIKGSL